VRVLVRDALDLPRRVAEQLVSEVGRARAAAISSPICAISWSSGLRRARRTPRLGLAFGQLITSR